MGQIHLEGFLTEDSDNNVALKLGLGGYYDEMTIATQIASRLPDLPQIESSKHTPDFGEDDTVWIDSSVFLPNVFLQIHVSDSKISLNEAINNQILSSIGELDIYSENYGYSEYTIMGFNVENFTLGGHDIENILKCHIGKYAHIVLEVQGS